MALSELSPALFVAMAICGGGSTSSSEHSASSERDSELASPDGWSCSDLQIMTRVELLVGTECDVSDDCDQVIDNTGVCPTDDVILNIDFDSSFLFYMIDQADFIDCDLEFTTTGYCSEGAEPACLWGRCGWL